ncbi:hypothetical protein GS597_05145 [Synechococcales cyanobacterium C]|uniref:SLH domain-containing protein n=1 Tax=Petrachloros mirabilis ULC683 TaxID=2781853 RepID=A0A8K1ZXJ1_9CYAN|nr:S-layer homology domain-containing protein [Petrachloros mirabilis]NCJ05907.1 hypothetical protein [Petrachloros mirabilis ULC683]
MAASRQIWRLLLSLGVISTLAGCNSTAWENAFSADPQTRQWGNGASESEPLAEQPNAAPESDPKVPGDLIGPMPRPNATRPDSNTDLDRAQVPAELREYLEDLDRLGVLSVPGETEAANFDPNAVIQRRTFARWLLAVNNRFYRDRTPRQIRPAVPTATPIFADVPARDPDFAAIQGLADAGYIPSPLTGDSQQVQFQPDAPLTRETLLIWKVPLDLQRLLPTGTATQVQQAWGFQDANRIGAAALSAVLADHQNGDLANIRRLIGSSLLLQPQKPVTHAEAAATLWFVGIQGEGVSAKDLLRAERQSVGQQTPPSDLSNSP